MKTLIRQGAGRGMLLVFALAMLVPATAQAATADLAITNADSPDPVKDGALLTYTIGVTNAGPQAATGVKVTDELDSQVNFASATSSQGTCDRKGRTVTCEVGNVGAGVYTEYTQSVTITITVRPKKPGQLTNTAAVAVGSGDTDPNGANNTAVQTTTVVEARRRRRRWWPELRRPDRDARRNRWRRHAPRDVEARRDQGTRRQ